MTTRINLSNNIKPLTLQVGNAIVKDEKLAKIEELAQKFQNGEITTIEFGNMMRQLGAVSKECSNNTVQYLYKGKTYTVVQVKSSATEVSTYTLSQLKDSYKFTDDIIDKYFKKDVNSENYTLNTETGCKTLAEVQQLVVENCQKDMVLLNFMNDKNRRTNSGQNMEKYYGTNIEITKDNYTQYVDKITKDLGEEDTTKQNALNKLINDYTQGNIAISLMNTLFDAIGVTDVKRLSKQLGRTNGYEFTFNDKKYTIWCNTFKATSGMDDSVTTTYNIADLKATGATQEIIDKYFESVASIDGENTTYRLKRTNYATFLAEVEKSKVKNEASETTNSKELSLYSEKDLMTYKLSDSDIKIFFKKNDKGYTLNKDAVKSCFGKEINTAEELLDTMQNGSASIGYIYGAYSMGSDKYLQYFTVTGEGNNRKYTLNKDKIKKDFAGLEITTFGQLKVLVNANATSTSGSQNATTTMTTTPATPATPATPTTPATTNNTSASSKHFTSGLLRGAHGLDETIINDCFVKINQDTYIMNMGAIKSRFPNSNITTLDDLVSAYKNSEMVYTESELKYQFRANPSHIDFMFKKNENGTYSLNKEKLALGNLPTRDIGRLAELSDWDIQNQFYEKTRKAHFNNEMTSGSEIKKNIEYYVELYRRGFQKPTNTCDADMLNKAVDYVLSELEISDNQQYNLSDMCSKFDSLLGDYITGRNKKSVNVNGEIDQAVAQGGAQDCWLIAGVLALNNTTNGKQILKNSISANQDGSVTVKFAGVNAEYRISYEEMKLYDNEASFATKTVVAYSVGDNDLLAIELAVKKLKNDIDNGKVVLGVDANSYEGNRANTLDGGYAQQLLYFLTGNTSSTKTVDIPSNASDSTVKSTLSKGLASSEVGAFLNVQNGSNSALTFSMYYSDKSAKCTDGSTFSVKLDDSGHTYAITNVDKNKRTVTFVDPSNSTKTYTMTWSEFAKMGIGMLSSTAINNSKVEVTPKSRDFDADTIIVQLYKASETASDKATSQNNFTVELFDVDSDLYKVSLALIKNIYAGAEDLTKFRDVLLQMAADTNFTPASFVKTLAEKLQSGDFEKAVDKQNQTKDLYTSIVSGYLSSLSADGAIDIGDFMQRLSNAGFSKDEMSPILDVFATTLYSMMLSQNAKLSQQDFTTMLYSGSIKASDINKAIKKSVGTQTGVALNEALAKEVSNAATSVMSANTASTIASSVYASDISNIMGIVNGDKEWQGHITIEGKDYDMSGYAWNKLVEENHSDAKAIYDSLKKTKSSSEYDITMNNGSTVSASLDRTNGQVNWVDNKGVTHTVKYEEKEDDKTLNTTYTIYGEKATVIIEETDDGYTISVKSKSGKKQVTKVGDNLDIKQLICGYAVNAKYSGRDDDGYDANGYDKDGYNEDGYDKDGYRRDGFNDEGINKKTGTIYDENGFDIDGINKDTNTEYNVDGYDRDGYDKDGYDKNGYDVRGFNSNDIHMNGTKYDNNGYDVSGKDKDGYYSNGYNEDGYDKFGYNSLGFDKNGYNKDGYDKDGLNKFGFDKDGCDIDGDKLTQEELFEMVQDYLLKHYEGEFTKNLVLDTTNLPKLPNLSSATPAEIQKSKSTIRTWINGVTSALGDAGKAVVGFLNDLYDGIKTCGAKVIGLFAEIGKTIAKGASSLVNCIKNIFKSSSKKSNDTTSKNNEKPVVKVFSGNSIKKDHAPTFDSGIQSIESSYTKINGKKVETGRVVTNTDGTKYYYDVDPNNNDESTLAAIQGANGVTVYYTPEGEAYAVRSASGKYMSYSDYQASNPSNATNNTQISDQYLSSLISELKDAGNTKLADALEAWLKKGCKGVFTWGTSGSSGASGGTHSSGITNGGYCPDGSWSPVAGSGWGSVMDGVIGVGGHGGTPVLGGGGGYTNNSYH